MSKLTLAQKKARPNNEYWRDKADELFMAQFRGMPCEVCNKLGMHNTEGTVFHHIVPKCLSKSLRYDKRNGIILCPSHHGFSTDLCPHSKSQLIISRFHEFCLKHFTERMYWVEANERTTFRYTYKQAYEHMKESKNKEFTFDMELLPF